MTIRGYVRSTLFASLIALAVGGFFLHLRIHPFPQHSSKLVPFISGILSIVLVPALFSSKKTISYGYVLNGMLVILGTVTMASFSLAARPNPLSVQALLLKTTLADIALLWGKFFVGMALFYLEIYGYDSNQAKRGISYRYPNFGWWLIHLVVIATVYALGHALWR
jgi:hypothetical protein